MKDIKKKNKKNKRNSVLPHYIVAGDHGYEGNYINSIIDLTGSE